MLKPVSAGRIVKFCLDGVGTPSPLLHTYTHASNPHASNPARVPKLTVLVVQLKDVYAEIMRVLKPGAKFCSYEWVSTKAYDPNNPEHVRIIDEINYGNGLPVCHPLFCSSVICLK